MQLTELHCLKQMWFYLHLANLILAWNSIKSAPLSKIAISDLYLVFSCTVTIISVAQEPPNCSRLEMFALRAGLHHIVLYMRCRLNKVGYTAVYQKRHNCRLMEKIFFRWMYTIFFKVENTHCLSLWKQVLCDSHWTADQESSDTSENTIVVELFNVIMKKCTAIKSSLFLTFIKYLHVLNLELPFSSVQLI